MKKKICFFTDSVYNMGGIQRVVTILANEFVNIYDVTVVCVRDIEKNKRIEYGLDKRIKVITITNKKNKFLSEECLLFPLKLLHWLDYRKGVFNKEGKISKFLAYDAKWFLKENLIKFFNEERFDYIFAEGVYNSIFLSLIRDKIMCENVVGCWHSCFDLYLKDYSHKLIKYSLNKMDRTVVLSKIDKLKIKKEFNVEVDQIYNPTNLIKNKLINLKTKKFVAIGRLLPVKGFDVLIEAFNIFHKKNTNWKLEIIGEGYERKHLEELIEKYKLSQYIELIGRTNEIERYYQDTSGVLVSSRNEGMPMVVLEAMQYGIPIIAMDIPILHEILPNSYEYIVGQKDIEGFAQKMYEISNDLEKREKISELLLEQSKEFDISKIINEWKKIIN